MEDLNGIIKDVERLRDQMADQMAAIFEHIVSVLRRVSESAGRPEIGETEKPLRRSGPKAIYPNNFARNVDLLRLECHFSYAELAGAAGLEKHTVLAHINKGTKPHPETVRVYAETFSAELGRSVSVSDLQR
jgi:hypothetical protein